MKWLKRIFQRKRTPEYMLISILDSMTFVLLHGKRNHVKTAVIGMLYRNLQRDAKNGRLQELELKMNSIRQMVEDELKETN